ncbi:MAG: EAL domain-containing protein [Candidatus Limnocylindrales bacterium]|jgi:EAL domain-containing protein (putative c-di-GMP-specific phosphodiesterase class I)
MNLPETGWLGARRHRPEALPAVGPALGRVARRGLRHAIRGRARELLGLDVRRPGVTIVTVGFVVFAASGVLELLNPRNYWILFEDISCAVAPSAAALAVAIAAVRGEPDRRRFRISLAIALSLTAVGQIIADVPDIFHQRFGPLGAVSDICYVVGAVLGVATLMIALARRLEPDARRAVLLDGVVIMAAAMTLVLTNWLHPSFLTGRQVADLFADPTANLVVPLVLASFLSSAAAAAAAALSLRIEPNRRGVWAVGAGIVLLALAWQGWMARFLAGTPDSIEPMDFIFPAGALVAGYGGVTWSLRQGGGPRYERFAKATAEWLPIVAIVGCAFLDVMPRSRPLAIDPIAVGTCSVVLLAMARYRIILGRERVASERLTTEMSERAATTVSLARLEAAATVEESADRICTEALRIGGIDTVIVFAFSAHGVVPLAQGGPLCRPVEVGEPIPEDAARELREQADFGLWIESWIDRKPRGEFDAAVVLSGLRAEMLAPLIWNDDTVGLLAMGATTPNHARRLSDRLATLTEFSVMSAAVLGPALVERAQREEVQGKVQAIIAERAFRPVYQPIVDLATGKHVGFEALARFSDGTRPDLCFLAADKVGMMVQLETAVLREQVAQARRLPAGSFLSLNVSPALATAVMPLLDVLAEADRPVVLEVTEHVEIDDYPRLLAALDKVRGHAMLAVDDAGAGYAGLRHILELRPQYVKLDISLVRNVDTDPARQAMVTGMAHFAESVGCALIAEGIETANELTALKLLRVQFGQGFFLAKPAGI